MRLFPEGDRVGTERIFATRAALSQKGTGYLDGLPPTLENFRFQQDYLRPVVSSFSSGFSVQSYLSSNSQPILLADVNADSEFDEDSQIFGRVTSDLLSDLSFGIRRPDSIAN